MPRSLLNLFILDLFLPYDRYWHEKAQAAVWCLWRHRIAKMLEIPDFRAHLDVASDTGSSIRTSDKLIVIKNTSFFITPLQISGYFILT